MRTYFYGYRYWSLEDDEQLKSLLREHLSISEVASILHRTSLSITQRRRKLQLTQSHWSQEDDDNLRTLHNEHWQINEIAKILNRTVEAIRHRKKHLHLGRCLKMDAHNIVRRRKKQMNICGE